MRFGLYKKGNFFGCENKKEEITCFVLGVLLITFFVFNKRRKPSLLCGIFAFMKNLKFIFC